MHALLRRAIVLEADAVKGLAVRFFVASTILTDTLLLAAHAARLLRKAEAEPEWRAHAYFGLALDLLLNLMLTCAGGASKTRLAR